MNPSNNPYKNNPAPVSFDSYSDPGFTSSFRDRADAINQAYSGSQIKNTRWDDFANWLGFRSSADKARMQLEQQRREALLQLKTTEAEQEYNSESAKAERMRAAGLNPDLQGLGDASDATEFNEPDAATDLSGLSTGSDVVSSLTGVVSSAISMYSGLQGLKLAGINIANEQLRSADSSVDHTLNLIRSLYSREGYKKYFDGAIDEAGNNVFSGIPTKALRDLGITSSRAQKQVNSRVNSLMNTWIGQIEKYKTFGDFLDGQDKYAKSLSAWHRNGNLNQPDSEVIQPLRELADFEKKILFRQARFQSDYFGTASGSAKAKAENAQYGFQSDYYSALNGGKRAKYENASAEFSKYVQDSKKQLFQRLTGRDASTFSLVLALQLMGQTDFVSNSGVGDIAGIATKFL